MAEKVDTTDIEHKIDLLTELYEGKDKKDITAKLFVNRFIKAAALGHKYQICEQTNQFPLLLKEGEKPDDFEMVSATVASVMKKMSKHFETLDQKVQVVYPTAVQGAVPESFEILTSLTDGNIPHYIVEYLEKTILPGITDKLYKAGLTYWQGVVFCPFTREGVCVWGPNRENLLCTTTGLVDNTINMEVHSALCRGMCPHTKTYKGTVKAKPLTYVHATKTAENLRFTCGLFYTERSGGVQMFDYDDSHKKASLINKKIIQKCFGDGTPEVFYMALKNFTLNLLSDDEKVNNLLRAGFVNLRDYKYEQDLISSVAFCLPDVEMEDEQYKNKTKREETSESESDDDLGIEKLHVKKKGCQKKEPASSATWEEIRKVRVEELRKLQNDFEPKRTDFQTDREYQRAKAEFIRRDIERMEQVLEGKDLKLFESKPEKKSDITETNPVKKSLMSQFGSAGGWDF